MNKLYSRPLHLIHRSADPSRPNIRPPDTKGRSRHRLSSAMHTAPADGLAKVIGLAPFDNEVASGRHFDSSDKAHRVSKKQASAGVTGAQSLPSETNREMNC